jgi:hypothetical protein
LRPTAPRAIRWTSRSAARSLTARRPTTLYHRGAEEVAYHLKNNPVHVRQVVVHSTGEGNTDHLARANTTKISAASFEAVKVVMEEAASAEAMSLEKGMIVLSTAVAGGPFIGLLGTVWGVMSTFAGIAVAQQASLTAMAPGVAARWWPPSPACWWPFRRCSATTSWSPPSGTSPGTGRVCQPLRQPDRACLRG